MRWRSPADRPAPPQPLIPFRPISLGQQHDGLQAERKSPAYFGPEWRKTRRQGSPRQECLHRGVPASLGGLDTCSGITPFHPWICGTNGGRREPEPWDAGVQQGRAGASTSERTPCECGWERRGGGASGGGRAVAEGGAGRGPNLEVEHFSGSVVLFSGS